VEGRALPMIFFHLPPAPFHLSSDSVLPVLLGIDGGLQITTDDDASSPIRLNQRREAKERRVRGLRKDQRM